MSYRDARTLVYILILQSVALMAEASPRQLARARGGENPLHNEVLAPLADDNQLRVGHDRPARQAAPRPRKVEAGKSLPTTGGIDRLVSDASRSERMAIASDGAIYLASQEGDGTLGNNWIQLVWSTDGGDTFSYYGSIGFDNGVDEHLVDLELAEGSMPRLFVFYRDFDYLGAGVTGRVAYGDLAAPTGPLTHRTVFSAPDIAFDPGDFTSDVAEYTGYYLYAVMTGRDGDGDDVWFTRSLDFGDTWETPYRIAELNSNPDVHYRQPRISYGAGSYLHVAFTLTENFTNNFDDPIRYQRASAWADAGAAAWLPSPVAITADDDGFESGIEDIEASLTDGNVLILYRDEINDPDLVVRHSADAGSTWPVSNSLNTTLELGGDLQYRSSTDEFILSGPSFSHNDGGSHHDCAFQVAAGTAPLSFGAKEILSDAAIYSYISSTARVALDPSRGDRIAMAWNSYPDGLGTGFDAEWRGDPGYPQIGLEVDLGVTTPGPGSPPALVDLDGDPYLEIVFADSDGRIHLMSHLGTEMGGWPQDIGSMAEGAAVAVGDLNGDGEMAIVAGNDAGELFAFSVDGELMPGFPLDLGTEAETWVAIGAVGGFNPRSIVATSGDRLFVISYRGEIISPYWAFISSFAGPPAIGDIDLDGEAEIVTTKGSYLHVHRLSSPGNILFRNFPLKTLTKGPSLGDLDQDGDLEILIPSEQGDVFAIHHDGTDVAGMWPYSNYDGGPVSHLALADFLGANDVEVAFTQQWWNVHVLFEDGVEQSAYPNTTTGGFELNASPVIDRVNRTSSNVTLATAEGLGWSFHNTGPLTAEWPKSLGNPSDVSPASGDIDLDGNNDFVFLTHETLVSVHVNTPPHAESDARWPMFAHNPQRTSCHDCEENTATPVEPQLALTSISFAPPSPNPSSGSLFFAYELPSRADVTLEIFDARGRRLRQVIRQQQSGPQKVFFDGRDQAGRRIANGQYFARLSVRNGSGEEKLTRKFSLVR